jgi:hypothetical protein
MGIARLSSVIVEQIIIERITVLEAEDDAPVQPRVPEAPDRHVEMNL